MTAVLVVSVLTAAVAVVATEVPADAAVGPKALTLLYDDQVYGDFLVAGNGVVGCPANSATCTAGANDTTSSTTAVNDSFNMTPVGANTANGIFNSSSAQVTVPSGAKVVFAQLSWAGSMGNYNNTANACGSQGVASRPPGMPAAATPANTPVQLKIGTGGATPVSADRENEDAGSASNAQQFYSAKANVTSSFANVATGSAVTITTSNVFAYQGFNCMGGWSIQLVYDYGQPTPAVPDKKEVFVYDGHVKIASGTPASATITGFRAFGPAKVGVVAYEGDNGITGDNFSINGTAQAEPRTKKTDNFFISNATGASTPNFPNNYSVDAKTFDVPQNVIAPGDTSANLTFGTTGDSYLAQNLLMSVAVPSLKIEKTASPTTVHAGDTVTFTIKVTNPTGSPANSVVVDDPNVPACNKTIGTLAGGASTTYTCTWTATKDLTNTANVSGKSSFNDAITGASFVDVRVLQPNIAITKTADATAYHDGDPVTFTIKVTNTGDAVLSGIAVTDAKTASCARTVGTLAAGDSTTYTCTTTAPVTGESNTANVTGTDSLGGAKGTVTASSTAPAPTIHPSIAMTKSASPTTITAAGQQVTYSFRVTNTSTDAPLTGVGINDTLTAPAGPEPTITCPTTSLAPGASTTCTGTYTATQADVDKGTIVNSATASGTDQVGRSYTSTPSTAVVTVTRTPALALTKSANPTSISAIGANVTYRFSVRNTGNVTVNGITVNDVFTSPATDVPPTVTCPATSLAPGAVTVCSATYSSVPDDFDNGSITNSATASGTSSAGAVTSNTSTATVTTVQGPSLTLAKSATPTTITAPGAVTYRFAVTNSGSVTIRNLRIDDTFTGVSAGDVVPTITCPVTTLAANATTTCTATYNATQADVDRGTITNSATANGTAPNGTAVASLPSTATVTATPTPKLTLTKTVSPTTAAKSGDAVTYTFAVTNSGNVTVTGVSIADPMFPGAAAPTCAATTLAPGASTTCTKAYTVTQADADRGSVTNTATAGGLSPSNAAVTSAPSTAKVTIGSAPKLTLTKSVAPTTVTAAGQNITYSFAVRNDGNVTVTSLSIVDTFAPPASPALTITCPATTLAPGASTTCTAPYKVTAADLDAGSISNSAVAQGNAPGGATVTSNTSTATVTAGAAPALTLTKTASPQSVSTVGAVVSYTFGVTNSGNVTVRSIAIADPLITGVTCLSTSLAAGASTTCTGSYTVTQADLNRGSIVNTATASGTAPSGATVTSPSATATVTATQAPALTLQKSASPVSVAARGDRVTYTFAVRNTGNVAVSSVAITDTFTAPAGPALSPITCLATSLAPNAATTCSATYTVTQADIDAGSINNSAKATGTTAAGGAVTSNTSTATVSASALPGLTLTKSVSPATVTTANTLTTYSFVVTNNGNQTVTGLAIADPMFTGGNSATCPVTSLAPGDSTTCTASRRVTQADVDAGKVTNTARATGTAPGGGAVSSNQSSAQVTIPRTAKLTLSKSAAPTSVTAPNGKITYTFAVRNTGNVTVRSIAITDTFTAPAGTLDADPVCLATTLAPSDSTTCTATYTVTQRDIDAGSIRNSATAAGVDPTGAAVTSPAATATVTAPKTASMRLLKSASAPGGALTAAGQRISYTFDVTNTGNVTLSLLGVQDIIEDPANRTVQATCPVTTVPVGETVRCTASYTATQDDIDSGSVDNTATATARDPQGTTVTSNPSSASVGVTSAPAITVAKTASPTTVTAAGQTVTYSFAVRNTGNVRLQTISIVDPMFTGANAATCPTTALDPGGTATCTAAYTVKQTDVDTGSIVNTARSRGVDPTGNPVTSAPSTATVTASRTSTLTLSKQASPATVTTLGQSVTYTFTVTNSGNTTITGIAVDDAKLPAPNTATCPAAPLLPGRSATCTGTYSVTQADLNRGTIVNTATANGTGPDGVRVVSPSATATVNVTQRPSMSLTKSVDTSGAITRAGQVVTYNFDVTDTGNVSVTVLAIIDRLTAPAGPPLDPITCADNTLIPDQTTRCTATYTVTQADVNNGSITNSAFARAEDPSGTILTSPPSTATVPIAPAAGLTVVKSADRTSVSAAGDVVTYRFVATNTGNVTLSLLAVQDTFTKAAGPDLQVTCSRRTLDPAGTTTCTGTYTVTQADIDAGSIENFATGSAQRPDGTTVTSPPSNPVTVGVDRAPALSLTKTASRATVTAAGQTVDYSFTVVNTGNVTVSGVAITDPMFTGGAAATCPVTSLAPDGRTVCTASYTVTQADIDAGSIVNTARARGTDPTGATVTSPSSTATVTATQRAHLTLTKTANPQSISVVGTEITHNFTIENDGNVTVTGLKVTDVFVAPASTTATPRCPQTTLAPGDRVLCTLIYSSTQADFDAGSITNTATASGTTSVGPVTSNPSSASVVAAQNPSLELIKSASPSQVSRVGQVVTYTFAVTNTGNVTLGNLTIVDPMFQTPAPSCVATSLAPGADTTCTATHTVTQADLNSATGRIVNTANARATRPDNTPVTSADSSVTVTVAQSPSLTVDKTADPTTISGPGTIRYSFLVTNTGNVSVDSIAIADPRIASVTCPQATLAPNGTETCTGTYAATQADVDRGSISNTARATGTAPTGTRVESPTDTEVVTVATNAKLTLVKTITSPLPVTGTAQVIAYRFVLTNSGNVTISNPSISDTLEAPASPPLTLACPTVASLAPNATLTCTADYTTRRADVEQGTVDNSAVGSGTDPTGTDVRSNTSTATAPITQTTGLTVTKTADPATATRRGDLITYSFTVRNTGNVSVRDLVVADTFTAPAQPNPTVSCPTTTLGAAGTATDTVICTARYTVKQPDVDKGRIDNSASATGTSAGRSVTSPTASATVTIAPAGALTVVKSASPTTVDTVGQDITYSFVVTNTGNVTVGGVGVTDTWTGAPDGEAPPAVTCPQTTLAPAESTTCTGTHTVTQDDLNRGELTNSAAAGGTAPDGANVISPPSTARVTANQQPGLSLVKSANPATVSTANTSVTYSFLVTNTGNVRVDGVTVADAFDATGTALPVTCPRTTLAPNDSTTCTATYSVTQTDLNRGTLTNTATAAGTGAGGQDVTSNPSSTSVAVVQTAQLTLVKSVDPTSVTAAGQDVTYSFLVRNSGNVSVTGLRIDDTFVAPAGPPLAVSCPDTSLAPDATTTCTSTYRVTQADADRGRVDNSAVARASGPQGGAVTSAPSTARLTVTQNDALTVVKTASPTTVTAAGQSVSYSFLVTNSGNTTVTGVSVDDTFTAPAGPDLTVSCPDTTLAPSAQTTCTGTYRVTQDDIDHGSVHNSAVARGTSPNNGAVTSPADTADVTVTQNSTLTLVKSASPDTVSRAGQTVGYSFLVTNTGNVTVTALSITDVLVAPAGPELTPSCPVTTLAPRASTTCTADYRVTAADLDHGSIGNLATATATTPGGGTTTSDPSGASVDVNATPALSLVKHAAVQDLDANGRPSLNDTITWSFTVTNSGNVTLDPVTIDDSSAGDVTCPSGPLAAGADVECTADDPHVITQDDVDAGTVDNTATASGTDPSGTTVTSDPSSTSTTIPGTPAISLAKSASPTTASAAGDVVHYSFLVTNTGDVSVTGVGITDTFAAPASPALDIDCPAVKIAPEGTTTCTADYSVTQADVDHGSVDNSAVATASAGNATVTSNRSTATVTIAADPSLSLAKSAAPLTVSRVGQTVSYSFLVTNTGNVTLRSIAIDDTLAAPAGPALDVTCPSDPVAPNDTTTCTAAYKVTQADLNHGVIDNRATASGTAPDGSTKTSAPSTAEVTADQDPSLTIVKSADPLTVTRVGQTVSYSFLVTNTGNVSVDSVGVTDTFAAPAGPEITPTCPVANLAPQAFTTCTARYTTTRADFDHGSIDNSAVATGTTALGRAVRSDPSTATVDTTGEPAIELVKKETPQDLNGDGSLGVDDTIRYTFVVTNTGNVTLSMVGITDPLAGAVTCPADPLPAGESMNCAANVDYAITQRDVDAGRVDNSAEVAGTDPFGTTVRDSDTVTTTLAPRPAIALAKSGTALDANDNGRIDAGDEVEWTFTVTNTGNVTLHDVAVTDPTAGPVTCPVTTLTPGKVEVCKADRRHRLTQADMDAGTVSNTATVDGLPPTGGPVDAPSTATVPLPGTPQLTLVKDAVVTDRNDNGANDTGDSVVWTFVVTNRGNVTVHDIAVDDKTAPPVTCPRTTLAPGERMTCRSEPHTITEEESDVGRIINTATVGGSAPGGDPVVSPPSTVTVPTLGTEGQGSGGGPGGDGGNGGAPGGGAPAYTGAKDLPLLVWSGILALLIGMFLLTAGVYRRRRV